MNKGIYINESAYTTVIPSLEDAINNIDQSSLEIALNNEVLSRISGDNSLENAIQNIDQSSLETAINSEISSRISGDVSLETGITTVETSLDTSLQSQISNRISGDNSLETAINSEISNRISGDSSLDTLLQSEISDRISGDDSLETVIQNISIISEFIDLSDTPDNYLGKQYDWLRVNSSSDGIEFWDGLSGETSTTLTSYGYNTGINNPGGNNVHIGANAGSTAATSNGFNNTFIGNSAGRYNENGYQNTYIGNSSGTNNINGSNNVFIGFGSGQNETGSNKLYISNSSTSDPLIYGEFNNSILKINGQFFVSGLTSNTSNNILYFNDLTSEITYGNFNIVLSNNSDTPSSSNEGTLRYRTSGNNSYVDICMQTGSSTYEWVNIVQNNW